MFKYLSHSRLRAPRKCSGKRLSVESLELRMVLSGSYLDADFGEQGYLPIDDFKGSIWIGKPIDSNVHFLPDDQVLVVTQGRLARFSANGSHDLDFGNQGIAQTGVIGPDNATIFSRQLSNGKILLRQDWDMWHLLNADGTRDQEFGRSGYLRVRSGYATRGPAVADEQQDGQILVAQNSSEDARLDNARIDIFRLNADGSFDSTFGTSGLVSLPWSGAGNVRDIRVRPDGKFLLAFDVTAERNVVIAEFNADGTLNEQFGEQGIVKSHLRYWNAPASLVLLPDGSFLVSGEHAAKPIHTIHLQAFGQDGALLSEYGTEGIVDTGLQILSQWPRDDYLALTPAGWLVVVGQTAAGETRLSAITPQGEIDEIVSSEASAAVQFHLASSFASVGVSHAGDVFLLKRDGSGLLKIDAASIASQEDQTTQWHNDELPQDVDGDGNLGPIDVLQVINLLNDLGPGAVSELQQSMNAGEAEDGGAANVPRRFHPDVDNDGYVASLDALRVINALLDRAGQFAAPTAEGEYSQPAGEANFIAATVPISHLATTGMPSFAQELGPAQQMKRTTNAVDSVFAAVANSSPEVDGFFRITPPDEQTTSFSAELIDEFFTTISTRHTNRAEIYSSVGCRRLDHPVP